MQTILGAGGDISTLLAKELTHYTDKIRLVARKPQKVNNSDELVAADLLDATEVARAVSGSEVVYLTVGLKYDSRVWAAQWPQIMKNVIDACIRYHAKLVFFDNVYSYAKIDVKDMTENCAINPATRKGRVRAQVVNMLDDAQKSRGLIALIARCADFYGPESKNGILNTLVLNNVAKGKKANWLADVDKVHSFTYTPDAAKATAILGNTPSAYGQAWHLPTSAERLNGRDLIEMAGGVKDGKADFLLLPSWMLRFAGLFDRTIKELIEMQYQYEQDYFFNSEKFCHAFGFTPTSYKIGIQHVLEGKNLSPQ